MRRPIVDPLQRGNDYPARRLGVSHQRDMDTTDREIAKRLGNAAQGIVVTLGPFYVNDLPGTATTQATLGFFNTATAVSRNGTDPKMNLRGEVIGALIASDDARTAGTATVQVRIGGTVFSLAAGACVLDATQTATISTFVHTGKGVPFNPGDAVGASVTTVGWTPTTANVAVWIYCRLEPI